MRTLLLLAATACRTDDTIHVADAMTIISDDNRLVLAGELRATHAVEITVPQTDQSTLPIRWIIDDGATVKKGDRVLALDASVFTERLREGRTTLATAEAAMKLGVRERAVRLASAKFTVRQNEIGVAKAKLRAEIPADLVPERTAQETKLALAKADAELRKAQQALATTAQDVVLEDTVARIELERLRRQIAISERAVADLEIGAPRDGVIAIAPHSSEPRRYRTGDTVEVGQIIVTEPDLAQPMEVYARLVDIDDGRVAVHDKATCTLDAYPTNPIACTVIELAPVARAAAGDSLRRTFDVTLALDGGDRDRLRPSMSVKVELGGRGIVDPTVATTTSVEISGELAAREATAVRAPTITDFSRFKITWLATEGTDVKAGDRLVSFDDSEMRRALDEANNRVAESAQRAVGRREQIRLSIKADALHVLEAEAAVKKSALLAQVPAELVASLDARTRKLDDELARLSLDEVKRSIELARANEAAELAEMSATHDDLVRRIALVTESLDRLTITAPTSGTIIAPDKRKVDDSVYQGDSILQIVALDAMLGVGNVDEVDIGRLAPGQRVVLRLDAQPDIELVATVDLVTREVLPKTDTDRTKVVRVKLSISPAQKLLLRPGMRFRGRIEVAS